MTIAESLVYFIEQLESKALSAEILESAKLHFADTVACIAAGANSETTGAAISTISKKRAYPVSSVLFSGGVKTGAVEAAMVNAISAHCRDYDDMSIGLNGHASAVLVPVCLSIGEQEHRSGDDVLRAYISGVEADAVLGKMLVGSAYYKGWNSTCTVGAVGAAIASGQLIGLTSDQLIEAVGMSAGASACVKENYGTAAKDVSLAMAVHNGIFAAEMAALGCSANHKIFEGENGVYKSVGIERNLDSFEKICELHTSDFLNPGMVVKPYPTCRGNHNAIDCFVTIVNENFLSPDIIKRVLCRVDQAAMNTDKYPFPSTAEQAKFSMRYCLALMLYKHSLSTSDFEKDAKLDIRALEFMKRIDIQFDADIKDARFGTVVEVETTDGRLLTRYGRFASGDPTNPISKIAFEGKLRQCFGEYCSKDLTDKVIECLKSFEKIEDVCNLTNQIK